MENNKTPIKMSVLLAKILFQTQTGLDVLSLVGLPRECGFWFFKNRTTDKPMRCRGIGGTVEVSLLLAGANIFCLESCEGEEE